MSPTDCATVCCEHAQACMRPRPLLQLLSLLLLLMLLSTFVLWLGEQVKGYAENSPATVRRRARKWRGESTSILVSRAHRLAVCFIHKNGCTSWIKALFDAVGRKYTSWETDLSINRHAAAHAAEPLGASMSYLEFDRVLSSNQWAK
eukprot:6206893-Pleurochrysis_carterae.AAC.4